MVKGYDDVGYLYSGPCLDLPNMKMPLPWKELATSDIGVLEMYSVKPCKPADDATVVKDALSFALEFAKSPEGWLFPNYKAGLEGFDLWIKALEEGKAHLHGMAFNTEVWRECRHRGADFLREAGKRLGGKLAPSAKRPLATTTRSRKAWTGLPRPSRSPWKRARSSGTRRTQPFGMLA